MAASGSLEYFPSYVFREQFHHPELVKRTILLGDFDALAIRDFFEKQTCGIFGKVNVKTLTDSDANEEAMHDALDWLEEEATQKDMVIIFLAAHGLNDDKGKFYNTPRP